MDVFPAACHRAFEPFATSVQAWTTRTPVVASFTMSSRHGGDLFYRPYASFERTQDHFRRHLKEAMAENAFRPEAVHWPLLCRKLATTPHTERGKVRAMFYRKGDQIFLVKHGFSFGLRLVTAGTSHVYHTTAAPMLCYHLSADKVVGTPVLRRMTGQQDFQRYVFRPHETYTVPAGTYYAVVCVQNTLFAVTVLADDADLHGRSFRRDRRYPGSPSPFPKMSCFYEPISPPESPPPSSEEIPDDFMDLSEWQLPDLSDAEALWQLFGDDVPILEALDLPEDCRRPHETYPIPAGTYYAVVCVQKTLFGVTVLPDTAADRPRHGRSFQRDRRYPGSPPINVSDSPSFSKLIPPEAMDVHAYFAALRFKAIASKTFPTMLSKNLYGEYFLMISQEFARVDIEEFPEIIPDPQPVINLVEVFEPFQRAGKMKHFSTNWPSVRSRSLPGT